MADTTSEATERVAESTTSESQESGGERSQEIPPEVKRALSKANKEAETLRLKLKEYEDREKTEAEKTAERLTAAEQRAAKAELDSLKLDVAAEKAPEGLPIAQIRKLASRLNGATREELEADADELFGDIPAPSTASARKAPKPDRSQGARGGAALSGKEAGLAEAQRRFGVPASTK